jgi:hypothetical protein
MLIKLHKKMMMKIKKIVEKIKISNDMSIVYD